MRRWLVLLSVICVLTAGAAAYAVIKADESNTEAADKDRVVLLERSLDRRIAQLDRRLARTGNEIDNLEGRLGRAGEESDVAKLDRRLRRVENDTTDAVEAAADAGEGLAKFERRLAALSREVRRLR